MNLALTELLNDAAARCDAEAASEAVLGYDTNAATYRELAGLARSNKWWVARQLGEGGQPGDLYPRT